MKKRNLRDIKINFEEFQKFTHDKNKKKSNEFELWFNDLKIDIVMFLNTGASKKQVYEYLKNKSGISFNTFNKYFNKIILEEVKKQDVKFEEVNFERKFHNV